MIRALILAALASSAFAQSFEAASLKLSAPYDPRRGIRIACEGGPGTADPGRFVCTNTSPLSLINRAYQLLRSDQLEWPHSPGPISVDLTATLPPETTKEQWRVMLQHLLIERFHLEFHWEKRDAPVYELTVAKNGPKMKKSATTPNPEAPQQPWRMRLADDGFPAVPDDRPVFYIIDGRGRARMESMSEFATSLSNTLGASVADATGLMDRYDFTLAWAQRDADDGLPLVGAIEAQLGLKLITKKGQKDVLVIDHLDIKPTDN